MRLAEFDYELPPERIAQEPLLERSQARLLVLPRGGEAPLEHGAFAQIVDLLPPGTVLVLNETRVIPARLHGQRASGGKVEVLLVRPSQGSGQWEALVKAGGSLRAGEVIALGEARGGLKLVEPLGSGRWRVEPAGGEGLLQLAERGGHMPLPPYIRRPESLSDRASYQTVFARVPGAIAAPTAGLHFTPELLERLGARGVRIVRVVLHVGLGTFCPVRVERVEDHVMESERYEVPPSTQTELALARSEGRPIVACGTTSVRALEAYASTGLARGETELFITPGYTFQLVDGLITNFHLPRSTLLMLVSALAGRERVLGAYREAVAQGYRFYSYGDAMFVSPS